MRDARYTALLANRASDIGAAQAQAEQVHVAGRYCESGDVLLRDIALPRAGPGDLLAIAVAGAYTLSMASNYNLTPRPALLLPTRQLDRARFIGIGAAHIEAHAAHSTRRVQDVQRLRIARRDLRKRVVVLARPDLRLEDVQQ